MPANRGKVMDRHGELLAVSTPVKSIAVIPDLAQISGVQLAMLAKALQMPSDEVSQRLASKRDFVYLKREVAPDEAGRIESLKLPGIQTQEEFRRYYPVGEVTSHVIGFTDVDEKGQEGMELALESNLAGKPGSRRVIRDRHGEIVEDVESIRNPQDGQDVYLALDAKIQYLAYSALKDAVQLHKAKAGAAIVLDARTGEILALVNNPTYNPNNRVRLSGEQLRNRVLTDSYEPGSTMKPFVVGMALESHRYKPDTLIDINGGHMTIDGASISDSHGHGPQALTVTQVIQKSSNIGAAKIALTFHPEQMWQLYDDLGFGQPLKLGFPGEVGGRLRPYKSWRPIEQATMAYGHGVSVTLMQLAHAYLAFAREGELLPLSLTKLDSPPLHGKRVFSPEVAKQVLGMLETVVGEGGTAMKAAVPGYRVGGKTGTAYKLENGHYTHKYVSSFIGVAPASDPRLVVAVMVDEPMGDQHFGGDVAAPVFSQITGASLRWMGVRPDAPIVPTQVARLGKIKEDM
jgi:cell division protein FtsI (penicillin-binding protein 3)